MATHTITITGTAFTPYLTEAQTGDTILFQLSHQRSVGVTWQTNLFEVGTPNPLQVTPSSNTARVASNAPAGGTEAAHGRACGAREWLWQRTEGVR